MPPPNELLVFVGAVAVLPKKPPPGGFAWLAPDKPPPLVLWPVVVVPLLNKPPPKVVGVPNQTPAAGLSSGRCAPKKTASPGCWLAVLPKRLPLAAGCWVVDVLPSRTPLVAGCWVVDVLLNDPHSWLLVGW